ncbi:hypothetical protein RWE87_05170 [Sinorhizobium meliloti]|uniref:hypothetical protein n=1 Tax=Rhizobium meliloti TaxID=382 RepID=UPI00299E286F|nr:hypothetical protein [Sinorhizobium meliloti]
MSIDGKTALAELVAHINEPYDGPWEIEEFSKPSHNMRPCGLIVSAGGTIIAEIRGYLDSCGNRENAEHITRCSPDRILAIAAYVRELETKIEGAGNA